MKTKLSLPTLIGVTLAFFATIRSVPNVAATGWAQIVYMLVAGGLFALPIALVSAELSTIWTGSGGPQVWVRHALGESWSFVVSWLLWIQMFFGMAMVASVFSVMLGDVIEVDAFRKNSHVIFLVTVLLYWGISFQPFLARIFLKAPKPVPPQPRSGPRTRCFL